MFGLTFLTATFAIAGAIGASIPLILHLLNRERARRLIFSTVRFIQMSHQNERASAQVETVAAAAHAYSDIGTPRFGVCAPIFR